MGGSWEKITLVDPVDFPALRTALDAPEMETVLIEIPFADGPFGAKGIGEIPHDVPHAAVAQAIEAATGAMLTPQGFIFVSSPDSVTPYHFDPEHNILLQIRGTKVMTQFPAGDARFVPDITPPSAAEIEQLQRRLKGLLGLGSGPAVQQTDLLMPESSGKFRLGYPAKRLAAALA